MCVIDTKTHPKSMADGDSDPRISQAHPKSMADGDPPAHGVEANILHLLKIPNSSISYAAHRPGGLIVRGVHLQRIFAQGFKFLFTFFKAFEDSAHLPPHATLNSETAEKATWTGSNYSTSA